MQFAYVMMSGKGQTDLLLAEFARSCQASGQRVDGVVQINTERPKSNRCDMDVQVLPDGPTIRISQDMGADTTSCALDPDALERAVHMVSERLDAETDLLVINKFGKHEASGRGFRDVIALALEKGVPVVAGLNRMNVENFIEFSGGTAQEITPTPDALKVWLKAAQNAREEG